ncbi:ABC transporter ATP-binding protein [uncultured Devosia sp.]|uniref:ABC transporter ATP-binding protein n=1 Tax=uncultured Devosia sp. TaxID=211434 RepID=UPI00260BC8C5|nr:ABC transporter ATP-binding protein [uncultured Devosia sp.]
MSSVSVKNLEVRFGEHAVLKNLDIDIKSGEFLVLLGSSGCGKSTLLNTIAGLIEPSGGTISIEDRDVTHEDPSKRGLAMVFQSYALYPKMSVRGNLGFSLRVNRVPKAERNKRVEEVARFLQITELLDRRPAQLSGGQRQRVAIGRALVREAKVFMFDEPLSNLDAKLRAELRVEIKRLHRSVGNTMIYVTHDQVEALTLADRIAVMKDGIIQQLGSPEDIYDRPRNRYVAGFIGTPRMNFIGGELLVEQQGVPMFKAEAFGFSLEGYDFEKYPTQASAVELGIRPELLTIVDADHASAKVRATVDLTEMLGAESIIWCDVAGQQIAVLVQGKPGVKPGDTIGMAFDPATASLFDAASGLRL